MTTHPCTAPGCPEPGDKKTRDGWLCYRHALKAAMDTGERGRK